jgi:hypothetical protein
MNDMREHADEIDEVLDLEPVPHVRRVNGSSGPAGLSDLLSQQMATIRLVWSGKIVNPTVGESIPDWNGVALHDGLGK